MSILIKGMTMPKNCGDCPLLNHDSPCWKNGGAVDWENRPNWCPLVELPPHGDLIRSLRTEFGDVPTEDICECDDCIMKSYVKDGDYSECVSRLGRAALEALEQIYESEE